MKPPKWQCWQVFLGQAKVSFLANMLLALELDFFKFQFSLVGTALKI